MDINNNNILRNVILSFPGDIYYKIKNANIQKSYLDCNNVENNYNNNIQFNIYPLNNFEDFDNNFYNNNQNNFQNNQNYYNNNNFMD